MNNKTNIIGKRFGQLEVIEEAERDKWSHKQYMCRCDCGKIVTVRESSLFANNTKSCGCIRDSILKSHHTKKLNKYTKDTENNFYIGETNRGIKFYIDTEDYDKIKDYTWYQTSDGRLCTRLNNHKDSILMHRLILNCSDGELVKHINGNTLDNRKANLKITNIAEINSNRAIRCDNKSGVPGVRETKFNTWTVYIKGKYYGSFKNKNDAIDKANEIRNISKGE